MKQGVKENAAVVNLDGAMEQRPFKRESLKSHKSRENLKSIISLFVVFLCISCNNIVKDGALTTIDLVTATRKPVTVEDVFDRVEYVILETSPECMVSDRVKLYVTELHIIVTCQRFHNAFLFARNTGEFIKQIGRRGRGPGEYSSLIGHNEFDEVNQVMYFNKGQDWLGIHIETEELSTIAKPQLGGIPMGPVVLQAVQDFFALDSSFYYGFVNNFTGDNPDMLVIFDEKGAIYKTFPNYQVFDKLKPSQFGVLPGEYYRFNGNHYFKEPFYNDTIYRVTRDTIYPHLVFSLGNKQPDSYLRESDNKNKDVYEIRLIGECERFVLFYTSDFSAYYDKTLNKTFICENHYEIDDFLEFIPRHMNSEGEVYGVLEAIDVVDFFEKNKDFRSDLEHLYGIAEEDNPVVVIAKLK